jgi:hypothetical protein
MFMLHPIANTVNAKEKLKILLIVRGDVRGNESI